MATITSSFTHPIETLKGTFAYLFFHADFFPQSHFITMENIQQHCNERGCPEGFENALIYIVTKTQELAKKMGIGEVQIGMPGLPQEGDLDFIAKSFRGYNIRTIELGANFFKYPKEEMEYILAHELFHIKHNDVLKTVAFNWIVMALNLITFRHFSFARAVGVVMLTNGIFDCIFRTILARHTELVADREALRYLNSNIGMVKAFHRELKEQYILKHTPAEELQKLHPTKTLENIQLEQMRITPHGNNRVALVQTTARLTQALNFKPLLI